jgi:hypothetical protein
MRALFLVALPVLLVAGCGDSSHGTVAGTVTMNGQPLPNAVVSFQPTGTDLNPGPGSLGRTNERGEFSLEVVGGGRGAQLGWHKVTIRPAADANPGPNAPPKYLIKGDAKFEVKAGANTANFEVTAK